VVCLNLCETLNLGETMSLGNSSGANRRSLLRQSLLCGSAWICGFNQLRLPGLFFLEPLMPQAMVHGWV
jgi:hypothetical protein